MTEIEKGFESATNILFGKKISNLHEYREWLEQDLPAGIQTIEGKIKDPVHMIQLDFFRLMEKNLVTIDEALELGKNSISEEQVNSLNLKNASSLLSKIKTTSCEVVYGKNIDSEKCVCYGPTSYCYQSALCWFCKKVGYSYATRTSEYLFGCSNIVDSSFCIKCYNSAKLTRCFEVSDSKSCTDCYFSHNCENLENSMFCFNLKAKRYCISNVEVGKEKYLEIKSKIIDQIVEELMRTRKLRYSIYNVGEQVKLEKNKKPGDH
jgi:hypothetical protein